MEVSELSVSPFASLGELSDEDLDKVAGGFVTLCRDELLDAISDAADKNRLKNN